jgi:FKBP-type peptidyl-prolyl cis-trans isomerase SlpA
VIHPSQIQPGSRVRLHVSIALADGTVAETTFDDEPLEFVVGDGTLISNLEVAIYGMRKGDQQRLRLWPEQAFGERDLDNVHVIAREQFPANMTLEPGVIVGFSMPDGEEVPGSVIEAGDERVKIDFNHPLAGHAIVFECEVLDVEPPKKLTDEE